MLVSVWLFVGAMAALATVGTFYAEDDMDAIMFGAAGMISWLVWAYGALQLEAARDATVYEFEAPAVAFLGLGFALIPAIVVIVGVFELFLQWDENDSFENV